ncbi:hypothetical protein [Streptomyces sp. FH025]|nr:hypothetical protein [Streptomyces sp. FH025]MBO1416396.1 hypothetical protein [Streptomyces sp. FH025]
MIASARAAVVDARLTVAASATAVDSMVMDLTRDLRSEFFFMEESF